MFVIIREISIIKIKNKIYYCIYKKICTFAVAGEMAEWSNAAVLKTVDCNRSWGSNPYFSAKSIKVKAVKDLTAFYFYRGKHYLFVSKNVSITTLNLVGLAIFK